MAEYEHLPLARSEPINPRRTKPGRGPPRPADPEAHARGLLDQLEQSRQRASLLESGFDPRLLLKVTFEGEPSDLENIPGLDVVAQEEKTAVVVFASDDAMKEFKTRLNLVAGGRHATRETILFAIKAFDTWTSEDRLGVTLRRERFSEDGTGLLDVELWPLERRPDRDAMLGSFENWCGVQGIEVLDTLSRETLVLLRLRATAAGLHTVLNHRDVRVVDLPPRLKVGFELLSVDLSGIAPVPAPGSAAAPIAVLDSGIVAGHPLLAPAVGEAASFLTGKGGEDEHGHGTMVAGLALYGDVKRCAEARSFIPQFHILSGRVTDENNENSPTLIENQVAKAVEYFATAYGCRVFNVSLGNRRRVYEGGHVGPWASILDDLARQYGVLFTVAAGNFVGTETVPSDWRREYPEYLFSPDARLLDPAPAVNALTVGSIARQEQSRMAERFPRDPAYQPLARGGEPSPFTRSGPGARGSIKPELVHFGGNWSIDARHSQPILSDLGEISTSREFAAGRLLAAEAGTSFAVPKITHLAAQLFAQYPAATPNLVRALIVAHARVPEETRTRLADEAKVRRVVGYGFPNEGRVLASTDSLATMIAQDELPENHTHFYEIPIPDSFVGGRGRRARRISVAIAHAPAVRRSRVEYTASSFEFRVVRAASLEAVARIFKRTPKDEKVDITGEMNGFEPKKSLRGKGTVQGATWEIKLTPEARWSQPLFLVVTRRVPQWAVGLVDMEPYAAVVVVDDSTNQEARLYAEIRAKLQARAQVRPRVRF
jgi:subtilisin family serine protease